MVYMKHKKKTGRTVIWALILSLAAAVNTYATEDISKVSITITTDLEAGEGLPDISIESDEKEVINVKTSSDKYSVIDAEWTSSSSKGLKIGDEPSMRITLTPEDESEAYFKSSYKASAVKINGGTFVSCRKEGSDLIVTVRLKPISGTYPPPDDAYWKDTNLGVAVWELDEDTSGTYEVWLYKGTKSIFKATEVKRTSYNLYPYMTEEGTYSFKVRTVPATAEQKKSGKKSEWTESGELLIRARDVSDGTGKDKPDVGAQPDGAVPRKGWVKQNGDWYYYETEGVMQQAGWMKQDENWYLFGVDGKMLTGWQQLDGVWYYLNGTGEMLTGWIELGETWYYLNPDMAGPRGAMLTGFNVVDGYTYYFDESGAMYKDWMQVDGKWYYFNTLEGSLEGAMLKGWINRIGKVFYTDEHGVMMTGWQEIDGNWYYFYPSDGSMAVKTTINGFYVNEDGIYRP